MKVFYDVGELGWALYLSAHIKWLNEKVKVFTDREPLFPKCVIEKIPQEFHNKFGDKPADCFTRYGVVVKDFFQKYAPEDEIKIPSVYNYKQVFSNQKLFTPYACKGRKGLNKIVIFPRYRKEFVKRNIPLEFYKKLIKELSKTQEVITVGSKEAYDIDLKINNYENWVGKTSIQDLIDICTNAKATIGSQSAPPKLALLQGTPTFMIGHEKKRHIKDENWMNTKAGFYEIDNYKEFDYAKCQDQIIEFLRG